MARLVVMGEEEGSFNLISFEASGETDRGSFNMHNVRALKAVGD